MKIRKICALMLSVLVILSFASVFASAKTETKTETYDAKDGFGINAAYGPFQLMYSLEHGDIWKLLADLHNLEDTYTTVYKGEGVSDWNFKTVNGEMCANATNSSSVVKFVAPVAGDYTATLKVHSWNNVLGVISVVGRRTNGDMVWNTDYRPTSTSPSDAASATFSWTLGKGDEIFVWIRETAEITVDVMTFSVTYNEEVADDTQPSSDTTGTVYNAKDGFGVNAQYGQFQLMYSPEHSDFDKEWGTLVNLADTYTTEYRGDGASDWSFKTVNGEMCASSVDFTSAVRFTAPEAGTYVVKLKVHGWDSAQGVVSTVGCLTDGTKLWNQDYRPSTTKQSEAQEAEYTMTLDKGGTITVLFSYNTSRVTIDTLTVTRTGGSAVTSDIMPCIAAAVVFSSVSIALVIRKKKR